MQHPPTDKILKQRLKGRRDPDVKNLNPIECYAADKQALFERMQKAQPDWFAPFPVVNPHKIIEESKAAPMVAAFMCQYACSMIAKMEERSVREYVIAAYFIACDMRINERAVESLARDVQDGRYKNGVPIEVVRDDILHYLFLYIFYQSGIKTRDRATQYAQGLKEYFYEGRPPKVVGEIILEHGPDRLRRVAQRKAKLIEGAQEWAKQGKNPAAPPFDEVLATLVAEETKAVATGEADETYDHGTRDLPHDGSNDKDSDPDWAADAEEDDDLGGEKAQDAAGAARVGDDSLPTEVDVSLAAVMRMTAQLFHGLNDAALPLEKRKALTTLLIQLVNEAMFVKRSLAERVREPTL